MGTFHRDITIDKGLRGRVKHRGVSKKKHGGRTLDDMTVVTVRDMVIGPAAGGELVVCSSNMAPVYKLGAGWSGGAKDRIEARLRDSDGARKGRVLYGVLKCLNTEPVIACVLTYHIQRAGEVVVTSLEASRELTSHRALLFDGMFRCAGHIACEHSRGQRADLEFNVSKDQASWYKEKFEFREVRKSSQASRKILGRSSQGCGAKAKRERKGRQQTSAGRRR